MKKKYITRKPRHKFLSSCLDSKVSKREKKKKIYKISKSKISIHELVKVELKTLSTSYTRSKKNKIKLIG